MTFSTASRKREACLLFGPQCEDLHQNVAYIRDAVVDDPKLLFLAEVLDELPEVWPRIEESWPSLAQIDGANQLAALKDLFSGKRSSTSRPEVKTTNLLLTPVTVARQLVEFYKLRNKAHHPALPSPPQTELRVVNAQGFCVGILAAITVACAQDTVNFWAIASNAVRLAVCVGALVDLDERAGDGHQSIAVRWKSQPQLEILQQLLKENDEAYISCFSDINTATVTLPNAMTGLMTETFRSHGLATKSLSLFGRFHHPVHHEGVKNIIALCSRDSDFQLPGSEALILPFRSNVTGEIVENMMLHTVALEAILAKQCNWWQTVFPLSTPETTLGFVPIGPGQFVPRAVHSRLVETHRDQENGMLNGDVYCSGAMPNATPTEEDHYTVPLQPIAIIGMAGRYPNADSLEELWEMLDRGERAVQKCPEGRFKIHKVAREPQGPFWGNYLARPDAFDSRFFSISSREAESMDPQQRLLLEVAYEAMESAGFCGLRADILPRDIGCYVGVGADDYTDNIGSQHANAFSATGTLQAFNTGRVSHFFGWTGPSVVVDTACSSSAVAIHLACKALQTRDCSIAVAGGVNVMTSPRVTQNLAAASFLSPTGASKAFDATADGYCRGEGAGLVVLRPLQEAIRSNDPIMAVITGTAVNQGSNCSPITVPHSDSQQALYRAALSQSNSDPYQVTYVEAHGTGTQVGDPIEFDSIREAFGSPQRAEKLYIGSIKDNIGHVETGSGVAGLLKTVLMMHKQKIPKQANFTRLNPAITPSPAQDQMVIPMESINWDTERRVALVTNYGAAGSNAAMVVQEHSKPGVDEKKERCLYLPEVPIFISAKTKDSLQSYCRALEASITHAQPRWTPWDLAYNLAVKQNRNMEFCASFTVPSSQEILLSRLQSISKSSAEIQRQPSSRMPVILSFGGQTGNTAHISQELFNSCILLRIHLTDCDQIGRALGLPSLFPAIFHAAPIEDIAHLHHRLFSIQYASAKSWLDSGLRVDRMIGHSFGQLTALCIADCLSLSDALKLVIDRARLIQSSWGPQSGTMIAIEATEEQIELLLHQINHTADVACINGDREWVVAGDEESIQAIEQSSAGDQSSGIRIRRLTNTHAFHSRLVDSIIPGMTETARTLEYKPLSIPIEFCSPPEDETGVTPEKIAQHSRRPVYFRDAVCRIATCIQGPAVWLEAGSASPVISMVRRVLESLSSPEMQPHFYQSVDLGGSHALTNLAKITSRLWSRRVAVQFWLFYYSQHAQYNWISLPPYQFAKNGHWIDYDPTAFAPLPQPALPFTEPVGLLLLLQKSQEEQLFALNTNDQLYQLCTQGHAVVDQSLCPASLYIGLVMQAIQGGLDTDLSEFMVTIEDVAFSAPLVLNPPGQILLRLSRKSHNQWLFYLFSEDNKDNALVHVNGMVSMHSFDKPANIMHRFNSLDRLMKLSREDEIVNMSSVSGLVGPAIYQAFERVTNYADYYRGVRKIFASGHEAMAHVSPPPSFSGQTVFDPVLLDNFLQVAGLHVNCLSEQDAREVFVCTGVGEILFGEGFMQRNTSKVSSWTVYTNYTQSSNKQVVCDIFVMDRQTGKLGVAIMSVSFTGLSIQSLTRALSKLENKANGSLTETAADHAVISGTLMDTIGVVPRGQPHSEVAVSVDQNSNLRAVQEMLRDLLGVEFEELSPNCSLNDIGIDSLMRTEVLSEITKRFKATITSSTLAGILDIQGLVECIFPGRPGIQSITNVLNSKPIAKVDVTLSALPPTPKSDISVADSTPPLALIAQSCFETCKSDTVHSYATKWAGFSQSVYPTQRALVTAYIIDAFRALGYPLEALQFQQTVPDIQVLPRHKRLKKQLYQILKSSGIIGETSAGAFYRTENPVPVGESKVLHEKMRQWPQHTSELELLRTTGPFLADCLTGKADGLNLIFQDAAARRLLEDVYTNAPMFKSATMHLGQYLVDIAKHLGSQREIRILEIGAGTGGTTMYLLEQLAAIPGIRLKYTFTDLSSSLITLARKKFSAYDFMRYEILDISKPPSVGFQGQFDIVLSSNCIHATENIIESCTNIHTLLRPNGIVCLIELTQNLSWFDLVFGLLEGWWLFSDGRQHALASERLWDRTMRQAGMKWVDWTHSELPESEFLRVIVASPSETLLLTEGNNLSSFLQETVVYSEEGGVPLQADIYYPETHDDGQKLRPIALMIHGGGHIMLSRKDIRPQQTQSLLDSGFLPISIDYRLCPEISLLDGPMHDACEALSWARQSLSSLPLRRSDIRPDSTRVVAVGWSSGGHLAMTLAWTAPARGIQPPEAILAFYCPTDYEDPFWYKPNFPFGTESMMHEIEYDVGQGMYENPITAYNPSSVEHAKGGWMAPRDPRSLIALHMNWKGQALPFLLNKWKDKKGTIERSGDPDRPTEDEVKAASPLAQIRDGHYKSPTFLIHGTLDDLIPYEQSLRTYRELITKGIEAEIRVLEGELHLFDIYPGYSKNLKALQTVNDGYNFLLKHVKDWE